ncbi:FAD-dependent oxidoreductase [Solirubrobacter taibaiensis]|nr:FAD-dependent oxidoreductase [Solirubrobacter taibaiensis]
MSSKQRVAVIGAGIAGLSAAYHLRDDAEVTIFERNDYVGGHAHTVTVTEGSREIGIDTAFVVCNGRTYPQLMQFFTELDVDLCDHTGGFNFFDLDTGVQFGSEEFELTEEQVAKRYPAEFLTMWRDAERFHREAPRDFLRRRADVSLAEYLDTNGYSAEFRYGYVVLLATAVWSVPAELIWELPASTLIAFYMAHDPGGLGGRSVAWKTVANGSASYVRRALEVIGADVRTCSEIVAVRETDTGVEVVTPGGIEHFDQVVVATHADEASRLATDRPDARAYLDRVAYSRTHAVLHTDPSVVPGDRSRWQSWNYGRATREGRTQSWVAYYMNRLQGFTSEHDYFVTLDCPLQIDPDRVIREMHFTHPIITCEVRAMQDDIYHLNNRSRVKFCGSYFHSRKIGPDLIGSHESAFSSGVHAAAAILRSAPANQSAVSV